MKPYNRHVHITASVISIFLALASLFNHGVFEIRQGFTPTQSFFIDAISETDRFWLHGTEAAFSLVPNFLITGILVIALSIALIIFVARYLSISKGSPILLTFFLLITLFGGGIGHLAVSLPTWAFSKCIHAPLTGLQKRIPARQYALLSKFWMTSLVLTCLSWLMVMQLGVLGYFPGLTDPDSILNIVFVFLFATTGFLCLTFLCAMAKDVVQR